MKTINFNLKTTERILMYILIIIISFIAIVSNQIINDYHNEENGNPICRYSNAIMGDGILVFGNAILPNNYQHFLGNHIWVETKEKRTRVDLTCPTCPIIERKGELEISGGYIKPNFNSIDNTIASLYYINFAALKYYGIIGIPKTF